MYYFQLRFSRIVLYPLLEPGDRVRTGPDWQWGEQGGGGEGTVIRRKDWKGQKDKGVGFIMIFHF